MSFQHNAFQHNAFQTAVAGGGVPAYIKAARVLALQQECKAREVAGYAVIFTCAALALSAVAPIGGAHATVGTHQSAVAASQVQPHFTGTAPPPVAAPTFVGRPIIVLQEIADNVLAVVYGPQPATADAVIPRTTLTPHQHQDSDRVAVLWGRQPPGVDATVGQTRVAAAHEVYGDRPALVWGQQPETASAVIPRTVWAPQHSPEQWGGEAWGYTSPAVVSDLVGKILFAAAQEVYDDRQAKVWGPQPESASALVSRTVATPHQTSPEQSAGAVWGFSTPLVAARVGRTAVAAQEQPAAQLGWSTVFGFTPAAPAGTDVRIGGFFTARQADFQPVQYAVRFEIGFLPSTRFVPKLYGKYRGRDVRVPRNERRRR